VHRACICALHELLAACLCVLPGLRQISLPRLDSGAETGSHIDAKGYRQGRSPTPVIASMYELVHGLAPSSNRKSYRCEKVQAGTLADPCFRFYVRAGSWSGNLLRITCMCAAVLTLPNSGYQRLIIRGLLRWTLQRPNRLECRRQSRFSSRRLAANHNSVMLLHVDDSVAANRYCCCGKICGLMSQIPEVFYWSEAILRHRAQSPNSQHR